MSEDDDGDNVDVGDDKDVVHPPMSPGNTKYEKPAEPVETMKTMKTMRTMRTMRTRVMMTGSRGAAFTPPNPVTEVENTHSTYGMESNGKGVDNPGDS